MQTAPISSLILANWNLEWAISRQARFMQIKNHLGTHIDVACFTKVNLHSIPHQREHVISSGADYGYKAPASRRKDSTQWADLLDYLRGLGDILQRYSQSPEPICILGDYNQHIPRVRQPEAAYQALCDTLAPYSLHTRDLVAPDGKPLIDHVASSTELAFTIDRFLPAKQLDTKLSDHTGYIGTLSGI